MESRANFRKCTLELSSGGFLCGEYSGFCYLYIHFLNSFTKLEIALFEVFVRVVECCGFNPNGGNPVYKSIYKLVCKRRMSIKDFSNLRYVELLCYLRYKSLILICCVFTDNIEYINGACVQHCFCYAIRHISMSSFLK